MATTTAARVAGAEPAGRAAGFLALAAAGCIWGTPFVLGKWVLDELSVSHMILVRFLFASGVLALAYLRDRRRGGAVFRRGDLPIIIAAGAIGVPVQYLVQFEGLARTTVLHASLMVGVLPVLLAAAASIFVGERLDGVGWSWLAASTVGAALVAFGGGDTAHDAAASLTGDALVVASLGASVVWVLLSQRLMKRISPVATTASVFITGTLVLVVWVLATEGPPPLATLSMRAWLAVGAMGVVGTAVTTLLWNWGLARVPASQAGVFVNLEPVIGALLGVLLFRDAYGVLSIVGAALILSASVMMSLRPSA
jgi:drug/metabolite transporter (DMT)-like permease